jgi:hypothetical protein
MDISKALLHGWPGAQWMINGESYDGLTWLDGPPKPTLDEIISAWDELNAPTSEPPVVTMRSFRLALGRTRYIELMAFVGAIQDAEQKYQAQTYIEYSATVDRNHPMVLQYAAALVKSDAEVDAVFATAQQLDLAA